MCFVKRSGRSAPTWLIEHGAGRTAPAGTAQSPRTPKDISGRELISAAADAPATSLRCGRLTFTLSTRTDWLIAVSIHAVLIRDHRKHSRTGLTGTLYVLASRGRSIFDQEEVTIWDWKGILRELQLFATQFQSDRFYALYLLAVIPALGYLLR